MKHFFFVCVTLFIVKAGFGQILNPVKLDYRVTKKGPGVYDLVIEAKLEPHWHIYSVYNPDGGAQATSIKLKDSNLSGKVKESGKLFSIHDDQFNVNQKYFENNVQFVQTFKARNIKTLNGTIEYMVCNDHQCLPPKEVAFKVKL